MVIQERVRAAAIAVLRVLLFAAGFFVLQMALADAFQLLSRGNVFFAQTTARLTAALVMGTVLLAAFEHKPPGALGFPLKPRAARECLIGFGLGIGGLLFGCLLLVISGGLRFRPEPGTLMGWFRGAVLMLVVLLIPAASEEALFRGYPYQKLVDGFGAVLATLAVSVAFAWAHSRNPSVNGFALANIFVAGVMLSVAYLLTRSLWFATGVHVGWNWSMAALVDLPVSGLRLYNAPLYDAIDRSPSWLGGGAFGPEAGMAGLLGLLAILAGVVWITRRTQWLR